MGKEKNDSPQGSTKPRCLPRLFERPLADFIAYCRIECGFARATLDAYGADLHELGAWMVQQEKTGWAELELGLIVEHMRYLEERGLAVSSIARHVATIRVFGRFLEAREHLEKNPAHLIMQPRAWQTLPTTLGVQQMQQLLAAPKPGQSMYLRDVALLELLYAGGLRASELAGLDCGRVHFDLGVVRVLGKGSRERIVPIGRPALDATRAYLHDHRPKLLREDRPTDRLLLSRTGAPMNRVVVWQVVRRHARRAGLVDVHPHTLRHSFATHLLIGGADLRVVQELLGHANIGTTQIYTHVDKRHLKNVIQDCHPRP